MKVVVCVKQIPDPATPGRLDPESCTLARDGRLVLDDADAGGVEVALRLLDALGGGEMVLVCMAPRGETGGLRAALAMGADRAILVSDEALAGSDALGTAKVLAAAVRGEAPDLVVAATESTDGYTGTTPVQVAELLGLPSVTFATRVEVGDGTVRVERRTDTGLDEVECPLPAVVTVGAGAVEPRYPSFSGVVAARSKPIDRRSVADLGLSAAEVGWAGARQEITEVGAVAGRRAGVVVEDRGDAHERIIEFLDQLHVI
ncbi:MAG: electron transfer flavoprotein subunit beta/FixA family protein [Actinomycetota bacterium]|nr:electron transfer flavoprotein subunit beta/FixA family protein [Actinomycetota bacterium]